MEKGAEPPLAPLGGVALPTPRPGTASLQNWETTRLHRLSQSRWHLVVAASGDRHTPHRARRWSLSVWESSRVRHRATNRSHTEMPLLIHHLKMTPFTWVR